MPTAPSENPTGVLHHSDSAVDTLAEVPRYYGRVLAATGDLEASACCAGDTAPPHLRRLIALADRCSSVSGTPAAPCC